MVYSFPIIANRTAYFAAGEGQLYAIDIDRSELRWKIRPSIGSELFTDPATDGRLIIVTSRQNIDGAGECAIMAIGRKQ